MARKRTRVEAPARPCRLNVTLAPELYARVNAYAAWRGETVSAVAARALAAELAAARFVVYLGTPPAPPTIATEASEAG
jgi:hypothetical protein